MTSRDRRGPRRRFVAAATFALAAVAAPRALALGQLFGPRLAGQAWDAKARRILDPGEGEARIAAASVALLGETHDNGAHHEMQRTVMEKALAAGRHPALAMEQFDVEWQAAIDAARQVPAASSTAIVHAGHGGAGWKWRMYEPLLDLALAQGLAIVALNIARAQTREIVRAGLDTLGLGEVERLALDRTWNAQRQALQRQAIVEGHCGEDSPLIDHLVEVQRARDAVMADRILVARAGGVIAIMGRGHARRDVGVPLYLAARAPELEVLSVGLVEAESGMDAPERYVDAAQFDLLWFTRRQDRDDPCAAPMPR